MIISDLSKPKALIKLTALLVVSYSITLFLWIQIQTDYKLFLIKTVNELVVKNYPVVDLSFESDKTDVNIKLTFLMKVYGQSVNNSTKKSSSINDIISYISETEMMVPIVFSVPKIESTITRYTPITLAICLVYIINFGEFKNVMVIIKIAVILLVTHLLILLSYFIFNITNNLFSFETLLNKSGLTSKLTFNNKIINEILTILYSYLTDSAVYFEPFLIGIYLYRKTLININNDIK